MTTSGYTDCACPDCFEIAVSNDMDHPDMCNECEEAGCDGEGECQAADDSAEYGAATERFEEQD